MHHPKVVTHMNPLASVLSVAEDISGGYFISRSFIRLENSWHLTYSSYSYLCVAYARTGRPIMTSNIIGSYW